MNWKPRPWFWASWLAGIAVTFTGPEAFAIANHGETFSAFMAGTQQAWPLWEMVWGLLIGGLAVHFWWHWLPPGGASSNG